MDRGLLELSQGKIMAYFWNCCSVKDKIVAYNQNYTVIEMKHLITFGQVDNTAHYIIQVIQCQKFSPLSLTVIILYISVMLNRFILSK